MENADKIVGALRCCGNTDTKKPDCEHCPLQSTRMCVKVMLEGAADLIESDNEPLTPDKLQALNSLEIVDTSICGDEVEYVLVQISAANIKTLLDAGFTTEQIDEAMGDDKDAIDLTTLAFNHTDAVWWDSERGFTAAQAGEDDNANEKKTVV